MTASIEHPFRRLGETRKLAGEPADRRVARLREKRGLRWISSGSLLLTNLQANYREQPEVTLLALLMLCHGTRLGETRTARWRDFALVDAVWTIPAVVGVLHKMGSATRR